MKSFAHGSREGKKSVAKGFITPAPVKMGYSGL
jgi:hypothetical protein